MSYVDADDDGWNDEQEAEDELEAYLRECKEAQLEEESYRRSSSSSPHRETAGGAGSRSSNNNSPGYAASDLGNSPARGSFRGKLNLLHSSPSQQRQAGGAAGGGSSGDGQQRRKHFDSLASLNLSLELSGFAPHRMIADHVTRPDWLLDHQKDVNGMTAPSSSSAEAEHHQQEVSLLKEGDDQTLAQRYYSKEDRIVIEVIELFLKVKQCHTQSQQRQQQDAQRQKEHTQTQWTTAGHSSLFQLSVSGRAGPPRWGLSEGAIRTWELSHTEIEHLKIVEDAANAVLRLYQSVDTATTNQARSLSRGRDGAEAPTTTAVATGGVENGTCQERSEAAVFACCTRLLDQLDAEMIERRAQHLACCRAEQLSTLGHTSRCRTQQKCPPPALPADSNRENAVPRKENKQDSEKLTLLQLLQRIRRVWYTPLVNFSTVFESTMKLGQGTLCDQLLTKAQDLQAPGTADQFSFYCTLFLCSLWPYVDAILESVHGCRPAPRGLPQLLKRNAPEFGKRSIAAIVRELYETNTAAQQRISKNAYRAGGHSSLCQNGLLRKDEERVLASWVAALEQQQQQQQSTSSPPPVDPAPSEGVLPLASADGGGGGDGDEIPTSDPASGIAAGGQVRYDATTGTNLMPSSWDTKWRGGVHPTATSAITGGPSSLSAAAELGNKKEEEEECPHKKSPLGGFACSEDLIASAIARQLIQQPTSTILTSHHRRIHSDNDATIARTDAKWDQQPSAVAAYALSSTAASPPWG